MKKEILLILWSVFVIPLLSGIVSASLYAEKIPDPSRFTSIYPLWSAILEKQDGYNITLSLIEFEWLNPDGQTSKTTMFYLNDGVDEYISDKASFSDLQQYDYVCSDENLYNDCVYACGNDEPCIDQCVEDYSCHSEMTCAQNGPDNTCGIEGSTSSYGNNSLVLNFDPASGQLALYGLNFDDLMKDAKTLECNGSLVDGICFGDQEQDRTLETENFILELIISDRVVEINDSITFKVNITDKDENTLQLLDFGDCEGAASGSLCLGLPFMNYGSCDDIDPKTQICIEDSFIPSEVPPGQSKEINMTLRFLEPYIGTLSVDGRLPYVLVSGGSDLINSHIMIDANIKPLKSSIVVYDPNGNNGVCGSNIIPEDLASDGACCGDIFYIAADACDKEEYLRLYFCSARRVEIQNCQTFIDGHETEFNDFVGNNKHFVFYEGLIFYRETDKQYSLNSGIKNIGVFYTYDNSFFLPGDEGEPPFASSLQEIKDYNTMIFSEVNDWLSKESVKFGFQEDMLYYNYSPYYVEIDPSTYPEPGSSDDIYATIARLIDEIELKSGTSMDNFDYVVLYLHAPLHTFLHGGGTGANAYVRNLHPTYPSLPAFFLKNDRLSDPKQNKRVLLHESFHPMGAVDIYGGGEGTARKDFSLKFFNCIMGSSGFNEKVDHLNLCDYTAAEIGWQDLDFNEIPEVFDSSPAVFNGEELNLIFQHGYLSTGRIS